MVAYAPRAGAQGDLEQGVAVQQAYYCDEDTEGEGVVSCRFVRFVESMGFREFGLVMDELRLLF